MDLRNLLGKLDQLSEGTMASAEKKPRGPKFTGKMKGTDPASAAKDKYVGSSMEESIFKELEAALKKEPEKRNLMREFAEYKKSLVEDAESLNIGDPVIIAGPVMYEGSTGEIVDFTRDKRFVVVNLYNHGTHSFHSSDVQFNDYAGSDDEEARMYDAGEFRDEVNEEFSDLERAVMEGGHELIKENPAAPAQPNKPTLGSDLSNTQSQQTAQQQQQNLKAQQQAAQKEKQEQATLQKGINDLKSAGAAVSNPTQVVKAFSKADDNLGLTPADKNSIASAGTILAPIMANPALQGKFKDLVTQASAEQKKQQQQQQANRAQATGGAEGTAVNRAGAQATPAGVQK